MTDERFIIGEKGVPRPNPALPEESPENEPGHLRDEPFDRRVVSYLLGQMSEEESEQFEDECFAQTSWPSHVNLVEEELIDAYLHQELPLAQRELFERNYLTTEARQARVRMAALLMREVCERDAVAEAAAVREGTTLGGRLKAFWGGGWGLRAAWAAAVLVIVVGGAWFYLARVRAPRQIATLRLTSNVLTRSQGTPAQPVKLSPDDDALRVFLTLPDHVTPAAHYRVELDTEGGATIPLAVEEHDSRMVSVLIPTSQLHKGQYALTLLALGDDGTEQPVYGSYIFAVE